MRLMFVYWKLEDAGSAQTIYNYYLAGKNLGHEVFLFGPEDPTYFIPCSLDIESADAVIFVLEWNIYLHNNLPLDLDQPVRRTKRERRIIIDNDGMYNDVIRVDGDYNHPEVVDSRRRIELYDSISDRIFQPTFHPLRPNVGTWLFHGYDPAWEVPLDLRAKEYGMYYVGSNWFRWGVMKRVLQAIEPIRGRVGRIGIVGHNWTEPPAGAESPLREQAYATDPALLRRLEVELAPAVPVERVIPTMSKGLFNPVLVRPVFNKLRLVNPRLFETPAANTIPLFNLDGEYVKEVYGAGATELVLGSDATDKIRDVFDRPGHYAAIVQDVRRYLAEKHSFAVRLRELIDLAKSQKSK
jgi:hypothetical protein